MNNRWVQFLPDILIRQIIVGILTILLLQAPVCQSGFNLTYDIGRSLFLKKIAYNEEGGIVLSGVFYNDSSSHQNVILIYADTTGQLLKYIEVSDPMLSSHLTVNDDSGMILNSHKKTVLPFGYFNRPSFGLALIDPLGNIETIQEYPQDSGSVTSPRDIIEIDDGYLITGWTSKPPLYRTNGFVMKTNKLGEMQWMHEYGHPVFEENSRTISAVNANYFVISGSQYQVDPLPNFDRSWAVAIDSLGNILEEWNSAESEIPEKGIASMQYDTTNQEWVYFTIFEKDVFIEELGFAIEMIKPVFVKRDSVMNFISYNEFGPFALNHYIGVLEVSQTDGWIAAGNTTCLSEEHPTNCDQESGRIIKLSPNGILEWSLIDTAFYHPEIGSRSYLSGVTEAPSGSIYAVGWANNFDDNDVYRSYGWLLKITKDGCIDTLCTTSSLAQQIHDLTSKVKFYPNPATDHLFIELLDDIVNPAFIELYDHTGNLLIRQVAHSGTQSVNLERAGNGICLWRIVNTNGLQMAHGKVVIAK